MGEFAEMRLRTLGFVSEEECACRVAGTSGMVRML